MKLFFISQDENGGFDTYSDAVVAAPDEETARNISPSERSYMIDEWCDPKYVTVRYIGEAAEGVDQGVICASYHAG
tara:strand:+ start:2755 stop:2982 length:228 start_codon:yes stop_codon:yes gene_type:complete